MSPRTGLGGRVPLPRTGAHPTRTGTIFVRRATRVKRSDSDPIKSLGLILESPGFGVIGEDGDSIPLNSIRAMPIGLPPLCH